MICAYPFCSRGGLIVSIWAPDVMKFNVKPLLDLDQRLRQPPPVSCYLAGCRWPFISPYEARSCGSVVLKEVLVSIPCSFVLETCLSGYHSENLWKRTWQQYNLNQDKNPNSYESLWRLIVARVLKFIEGGEGNNGFCRCTIISKRWST